MTDTEHHPISPPERPGPAMPRTFAPTMAAAHAALAAVRPGEYARSRNALDGASTRLSPYITHGFLTLPEVVAAVTAREPLEVQHLFIFELGWREYFQHVWQHRGAAIFESLHAGVLPDAAYADSLPADLLNACTGVPAIDTAVRTLYATGHLHNHARMWLASYVVHIRKRHWRAGAEWLYGHLLDGDLASNHLSWQWVAGTGSSKPYLFNADNVARFASAEWHSPGTVLDTGYDALEQIARDAQADVPAQAPRRRRDNCIDEPKRFTTPPPGLVPALSAPNGQAVRGRDVWLVHPWALGSLPADLAPNTLCVAAFIAQIHAEHAWSAARWRFVATRMAELASVHWFGSAGELATALSAARSVQTLASAHLGDHLTPQVVCRPVARLFPTVATRCDSFSRWWSRATRQLCKVIDLPGLALAAAGPATRDERGANPAVDLDRKTSR